MQLHYDALYCGGNVVPESLGRMRARTGWGAVSDPAIPATVPSWYPSLSSANAYLEMQLHPIFRVICCLSLIFLWSMRKAGGV